MLQIKINNFEFFVKPHVSILDACKYAGINVPRFCYHEMLSVSGNCRMCLVEIEGLEKPLASCVAEVDEGMSIWVDTPFVKKARENVVEALLLNHPLDCPICDQAGECDLQDQTKTFGSSYSRFFFNKKGVEDKYCGPLIKTIMTRCITCTRCVRFASEVAGVDFFGTMNRGSGTEIGAYVVNMFDSEISGNVIDLCPVGALTSRPYAFRARPWELRLSESIDTTDALGSNIYINYKETEIFRVLPKNNTELNNSIISDKARFSYDANHNNRINNIFTYSTTKNIFKKISWSAFFEHFDTLNQQEKFEIVIDEKCDLLSIIALKKLVNKHPQNLKLITLPTISGKNNYYTNIHSHLLQKLNNVEDLVIFLGSNLRLENAILNATVRFKYKNTLLNIQSYGLNYKENIPTSFINLNISKFLTVFEGKSNVFSNILLTAKSPLIFVGENIEDRLDNVNNFIGSLSNILAHVNFVFLKNSANSEGINYLGQFSKKQNLKTPIAINLDDTTITRRLFKNKTSGIWLNSHGSQLATKFTTLVPTLTAYESEQIYLNLEARPQKTQKSFATFFDVKSTFNTITSSFNLAKSEINLTTENYTSAILEQTQNLDLYSSLKTLKSPFKFIVKNIGLNTLTNSLVSVSTYPIKQKLKNFYCSDLLTKNSLIMQECSKESTKNVTNFY
jgi:NADH-quinone oxidoreductase chain G